MIIDNNLVLSNNQVITATAASTNSIDLGQPGTPYGAPVPVEQDIGKGGLQIPIAVNVTSPFTGLASLGIALQVSSDNATWKEVATHTYLPADLSSVKQLDFPAQLPIGTNLRYLQMNYTVTGTAPVAGNISTAATGGTLAAATYYYKVTAILPAGEGSPSNEVSQVTTGTTSTVTLAWSAVPGATGYRVYRGTAAGVENVYYAPGNVTTYTDTGAANTAGTPPAAVAITGQIFAAIVAARQSNLH